ncbi:hypothetical protein HZF08_03135 [Paenibacillus sp. CGMCC 1.16610]|uniref:Uncharacterized protein n=1 Tax=Paenibacillus anseongense TaxID=2682845 RepID=A0ABW9UAT7_9BACL|nr:MULTISPECIES: hypothetical protein [Paenibacillus]MBA2937286.1 hypothetical protein [Paenibacillus sp. CGMCC 1.16610]MVQ36344.1 hypothetical protein [Paenibacillus anseongense]
MLNISILKGLSHLGAVQLLLEEGYLEETLIEQTSDECDMLLQYPFTLYDGNNRIIDQIIWVEYCVEVAEDEYEDLKSFWSR